MTPIQQLMLGVGAKKKTYLDDVFSTYLHAGNETAKSIVNGVDLTKGGLVWTKNRSHTGHNYFFDTERGATKYIKSNQTNAEGYDNNTLTSFNNNGFSLGVDTSQNENGRTFSTWSFRKAEGFFDVVTYTGNGSNRTIAHSLGSVPGMIMVKCTSESRDWAIYHRNLEGTSGNEDNAGTAIIFLNTTEGGSHNDEYWNDTAPTSTHFSVGTQNGTNKNGATYVAYVFAGGESTAATARSVDLDGSGDYLDVVASSDFSFGSGDFTVEGWFKVNSTSAAQTIIGVWDNTNNQRSWLIEANNSGGLGFSVSNNGSSSTDVVGSNCVFPGQWTHFAAVRDGDTLKLFVNGTQVASSSYSMNVYANSSDKCFIGLLNGASNVLTGKLSNIRVVKGTAVYTSSFKPPTEPLTNITNTKLLCCNNASVTGSTVTPGTIDATGDPTASTDSPFDDPAAFKFGENKDQNAIKCGSYVGNASTDGPEVYVGWEPQWILIKNASASQGWRLFDSMRGIATNGVDARLFPNNSDAESDAANYIDLTPTGFKLKDNGSDLNGDGDTLTYVAIRRPDGYVGKPADAGTGVLAMDTGAGGSTVPGFDSGFPVDFALTRQTASSDNWYTYSRLMGHKRLKTDTTGTEDNDSSDAFDSNVGWYGAIGNHYQAWLWKRHAGFDVVTYEGTGSTRQIPHSLNKTPEMIWVKRRNTAAVWRVYHKGLNGGSSPEGYNLNLNNSNAEENATTIWTNAPTSLNFSVGTHASTNQDDDTYIAMLFASVDGISKVGYYSGSNSAQTITTGFQPRFVIIKNASMSSQYTNWFVLDTTRGWGSGDDKYLKLNDSSSEANHDFGYPTSNGFYLTGDSESYNQANSTFIYYAHA